MSSKWIKYVGEKEYHLINNFDWDDVNRHWHRVPCGITDRAFGRNAIYIEIDEVVNDPQHSKCSKCKEIIDE